MKINLALSPQQRAKLRVCASCEWVFLIENADEHGGCPMCGFAHYGARFVYGDKAYKFAENQEPWMNKKLSVVRSELYAEMQEMLRKRKLKILNRTLWCR